MEVHCSLSFYVRSKVKFTPEFLITFFVYYLQAGQGKSQSLVKAMDDYGLGVAATFNESTKSKVVQTKNLIMRIDRVDQDSPVWTRFCFQI